MWINTISYYRKLHLNVWKTLLINFKCFPFADAIKFPVFIFGKAGFEGLRKGCIIIDKVHTNSIKIGGGYYTSLFGFANCNKTYLKIDGELYLGNNTTIDQGCLISVAKGAKVKIGEGVYINRNTKLHAKLSITIGRHTRIGWDSQVYDTNFHYTVHQGRIYNRNKPVVIDHNVWVGNSVTVAKGTILPAFSVVAAKSLVNKDYSQYGECCLFGGAPAKYISGDIKRLLDVEQILSKLFDNSTEYLNWDDVKEQLGDCF